MFLRITGVDHKPDAYSKIYRILDLLVIRMRIFRFQFRQHLNFGLGFLCFENFNNIQNILVGFDG